MDFLVLHSKVIVRQTDTTEIPRCRFVGGRKARIVGVSQSLGFLISHQNSHQKITQCYRHCGQFLRFWPEDVDYITMQ